MIVDWLSLTIPVEPTIYEPELWVRAYNGLRNMHEQTFSVVTTYTRKPSAGRAPYSIGWRAGNVQFFAGIGKDTALMEVSGMGCEDLRLANCLSGLILASKDRVTRLDIAIDILSPEPDEIIAEGYSARFKAHSRVVSAKGITCYIGSPKSERYCRVYRYAPPHPRSHLTRIELVHRKRYAKIAAEQLATKDIREVAIGALQHYGFNHPDLPNDPGYEFPTVAIAKSQQKTLTWLVVQVAPAVRRLIQEGVIKDANAFFGEHFLPAEIETPPSL